MDFDAWAFVNSCQPNVQKKKYFHFTLQLNNGYRRYQVVMSCTPMSVATNQFNQIFKQYCTNRIVSCYSFAEMFYKILHTNNFEAELFSYFFFIPLNHRLMKNLNAFQHFMNKLFHFVEWLCICVYKQVRVYNFSGKLN